MKSAQYLIRTGIGYQHPNHSEIGDCTIKATLSKMIDNHEFLVRQINKIHSLGVVGTIKSNSMRGTRTITFTEEHIELMTNTLINQYQKKGCTLVVREALSKSSIIRFGGVADFRHSNEVEIPKDAVILCVESGFYNYFLVNVKENESIE